MTTPVSFESVFAVMASASTGDTAARVELPDAPDPDDTATRFAIALNLLLDDLELRTEELRRTQEQLFQSQKMEALGRLAGGIAHDFNNLLSVVLSYSSMLVDDLKPGDPIRADIQEIRVAGERAAALVNQLLAFSRQQVIEPTVLDLNKVVGNTEKMIRRILGEDIALKTITPPDLGKVKVDAGQVEQVIMNLVVNARDAMPSGGRLTIETANVELDEAYARKHVGVTPGPHVMLAVSDTGEGMTKETQSRLFEPFFTTKATGTGLGLATVFGIVKQSGGNVWVYSEPGEGTTSKVYLPEVDEVEAAAARPKVEPADLRGSETVLVVEDEGQIRAVVRVILESHGYQVLEAAGAGEALLVSEKHHEPLHLLLTDIVMPEMSGTELVERLQPQRPEMRVLYMSGYTQNAVVHHGIADEGVALLQKPITPQTLLRRVREVLDS